MLPISFMRQTVEVVTPALIDDRGTITPDWDAPPANVQVVERCSVQPGASAEVVAARQNVVYRWTVFMPASVVIGPHDGVRVGGVLHQVEGGPKVWVSPTGALDHAEVYLIDWTG